MEKDKGKGREDGWVQSLRKVNSQRAKIISPPPTNTQNPSDASVTIYINTLHHVILIWCEKLILEPAPNKTNCLESQRLHLTLIYIN